jgi:hypothetical protein
MIAPLRTLRSINEANSRFWRDWRAQLDRRMNDEAISATASDLWQAQQRRSVPLDNQFPFETALEDAERLGQRFLRRLARQGGAARKAVSLQILIENVVERDPNISRDQLLRNLEAQQHVSVIQDIDEETIYFTTNSGRPKHCSISGLKDRLSRAKKTVGSR